MQNRYCLVGSNYSIHGTVICDLRSNQINYKTGARQTVSNELFDVRFNYQTSYIRRVCSINRGQNSVCPRVGASNKETIILWN